MSIVICSPDKVVKVLSSFRVVGKNSAEIDFVAVEALWRELNGVGRRKRFEFTEENLRRIGKYMEENPELKQQKIADHFGFHKSAFLNNKDLKTIYTYIQASNKEDARKRYKKEL